MSSKSKFDLYKDLLSIEPRISREERLSYRRGCIDSTSNNLQKAKNASRYTYFFFLALILIFFSLTTILKRQQNFINTSSKKDNIILQINNKRTIEIHWITQEFRHGVSLLIKNSSSEEWVIPTIKIYDNTTQKDFSYTQELNLAPQSFDTLFIPLPKNINTLKDLTISL